MKYKIACTILLIIFSLNIFANELDESLRVAVNENKIFTSLRLLIKGADPTVPDDQGITALQIVTSKKMHLVLELMLAVTKKLDDADARGWSPLFYAIQNHSYFVLKELLAKDASPDQREKITGLSPLEYSIQISSRKTIDLLLKKGAQITGQDYHGNNAIMYAAEKFDHKLLIKLYERYKDEFLSQILHKNSNNEMALSFAAQNQNVKAAILLYALGERRYSPAFELNYVLDSSNHLPIEYFNLDAKQIFDCAANKIELFGRKSDWENAEKLDNYTETLYEQCNQKSNY